MKPTQEIEEICKKLKPIIGDEATELWYMYLAEDDIGRKKLALDIEILAEKLLKEESLSKQTILLDPPSLANSSGSILIGDVFYNNKKLHSLYLKPEDFIKQVGIFAVTGEGKTNLAYLFALQLLKLKIPFIVIDWKRSWRNLFSLQDKFPELKQVQIYTIGRNVIPFYWNPFRPPPCSDKELWISTIADTLEKSHISGPGVAYFLDKIYSKLFKSLNNSFYPNFYDGLKELENIKARERELKWKQTALRILNSFTIGSASKAFNARNPIKLEHLLDKPVILELDLEMPKSLRIFFTETILRWIHLYRLNQGETEKLRHVLFLEEAHNLFTGTNNYGAYKENNNLENIYREIRAFGQGIVSITQHPSLLPIYLLGNCHTQIFLGLQHEDDIRTAKKSLFLKYEEEPYLNMIAVGECVVKIKNRVEPCLVKTPLIPIKKGEITDDWLRVNTPGYLPNTHNGKGPLHPGYLPSAIYNKENSKYPHINNHSNKNGHYSGHNKLLIDIFENPFSTITQRYKNLKLNPKYGNQFKNLLISQGCIQPKKIITGKGWITLFDLTQKGRMILRDLGYEGKVISEGIIHKFWKYKIADYYKQQGFEVLIEENINGRPDIIVKNGNKKVAIEIETGKSNYIENIKRDLDAGFDEVISVATNKSVEEKIREELNRKKILNNTLNVTSVLGFDLAQ